MLALIKPSPIFIIIATTLGIMMHDMHLDHAATAAIALPSYVATSGALEKTLSPTYHIHVERAETSASSLPKLQQPREDTRRYVQNKKLNYSGGGDAVSLWPSV